MCLLSGLNVCGGMPPKIMKSSGTFRRNAYTAHPKNFLDLFETHPIVFGTTAMECKSPRSRTHTIKLEQQKMCKLDLFSRQSFTQVQSIKSTLHLCTVFKEHSAVTHRIQNSRLQRDYPLSMRVRTEIEWVIRVAHPPSNTHTHTRTHSQRK